MAAVAHCQSGRLVDFPFDVGALVERSADNEIIETPSNGVVIRGVLNQLEQRDLYEHLWNTALFTETHDQLQGVVRSQGGTDASEASAELKVPWPLAYWTHPYSRACSVREAPERLLRWAGELLHTLVPETCGTTVDSMLAQVYFARGSLGPHLDRDLSWGLALSLGASAHFRCWHYGNPVPEVITLHSGDLIVGDFGTMLHSVEVLDRSTAPAWWDEVPTLGSSRCNVLFRQALSEERQQELSEPRARVLHGISFRELIDQRGQTVGECALALRHEMDGYDGKDAY